jgi:hypothetical protein
MPFQVSPGVNVTEIDLTTVVPAVSTTEGAIAGVFRWGPVDKRVLVDSESTLAQRFGKPTNLNAETFLTAANFLSYGNKLYVARTANTTPAYADATSTVGDGNTTILVANAEYDASSMVVGSFVLGTGFSEVATITAASANDDGHFLTVDISPSGSGNTDVTLAYWTGTSAVSAIAVTDTAAMVDAGYVPSRTTVLNDDAINDSAVISNLTTRSQVQFVARYPGELGNSLKVSVCDTTDAYSQTLALVPSGNTYLSVNGSLTYITATTGSNTVSVYITKTDDGAASDANTRATDIRSNIVVGDLIEIGNNSIGTQKLRVTGVSSVTANDTTAYFTINTASKSTLSNFDGSGQANVQTTTAGNLTRYWEYYNSVDAAPGTSQYVASFGNSAAVDEIHVVVVDEDGRVSGVPGTVLEAYNGLSRATDAKSPEGASTYFKEVINQNSQYIYYAGNARANNYSNTALNMTTMSNTAPMSLSFITGNDGSDEANVAIAELIAGYDLFKSAEDVDVSLILQGKARGGTNGAQLANHLIDNIAESRKDCVVFVTPDKSDTVLNGAGDEAEDIVAFRNDLTSTSYAVVDSGYKYQYDKYNDVYRYVPMNGDVAGLCVRTDDTRDPWYSPAGFNRGAIKNVVKLAFNPNKAQRDLLYKNGINPVVTFPGQGTILFGDKTALAKPSAFDRINVRRLFIVLEKAIATAAKFTLFEFNDDFTRAQFKNLVEPFLRDVQGRRGITDFRVVCDETNNTGEVIDRNEFVGDIYIKPARSINFIQLNFVAVRTGVEFSEIVGQF